MVRTSSAGIKISSGKSSKKGGGGGGSSSSRGSTSSTSSKSSAKGSARLPPIPHQETPSWQKPITNFFQAGSSSLKNTESTNEPIKDSLHQYEIVQTEKKPSPEKSQASVEGNNKLDGQQEMKESKILQSQEVAMEYDQAEDKEKIKPDASVNDHKENETNLANLPNIGKHTKDLIPSDEKSEELKIPGADEVNTVTEEPQAKKLKKHSSEPQP